MGAYNSGGVPYGGLTVTCKRPTVDSNGVPTGGSSTLGTYLVESCGPTTAAVLNKRPGVDGGKNGWWMVDGDTEGAVEIQLATTETPHLQNGDYFDADIRVDANGDPVTERFVMHDMSPAIATTQYRKQSGQVIVDAAADL